MACPDSRRHPSRHEKHGIGAKEALSQCTEAIPLCNALGAQRHCLCASGQSLWHRGSVSQRLCPCGTGALSLLRAGTVSVALRVDGMSEEFKVCCRKSRSAADVFKILWRDALR